MHGPEVCSAAGLRAVHALFRFTGWAAVGGARGGISKRAAAAAALLQAPTLLSIRLLHLRADDAYSLVRP